MSELTKVVDFNDFNYQNIAFDIVWLGHEEMKALYEKLKADKVNHLSRFKDSNYFAIWNSDFQGFDSGDDIYFDSPSDKYDLARLRMSIEGEFYYRIVGKFKVREGLLM